MLQQLHPTVEVSGSCSPGLCSLGCGAAERGMWVCTLWEGLCCCPMPALGYMDKYSKLCTGRTHTAEPGNSSDPLGWAGRAGGVNSWGCNQHLQLASAPAGLKGSATKCSIPHRRSSLPPLRVTPARALSAVAMPARTCLPGWDKYSMNCSWERIY